MNKTEFEKKMHDQTELPGDSISTYDLKFICHRYIEVMPLTKDKSVLEIGAGSIIGKEEMVESSKFYVGADLTEQNLLNCSKSNFSNELNLIRLDAHHIPFADNSFDVIIALAMIYYLDIDDFLNEVRRVLKPGGKLFFCSSNKDLPGFVASNFTKNYYSVDELNKKLAENGFKAKFKGAFKEFKLGFYGKIFSILKETFKRLSLVIFGNNNFWLRLRSSYLGKKVIIPDSLNKFPDINVISEEINSYEKNSKYKIIYCTAILENP